MNAALIKLIMSGASVCMTNKPNMPVKVVRHTSAFAEVVRHTSAFAEVVLWDAEKKVWMYSDLIHAMALYSEPWKLAKCPDEGK
jgi:hypothetical protein